MIMRSNWRIYLEEMNIALMSVQKDNQRSWDVKVTNVDLSHGGPMSNFEKKYNEAKRSLYELNVDLGQRELIERLTYLRSLDNVPNLYESHLSGNSSSMMH